jgi:2'-5' RNA ligase
VLHGSHISLNARRAPAWLCGALEGHIVCDAQPVAIAVPPRTGVWDQLLKDGRFTKKALDGTPTVTTFDDLTCGQILDAFRDQQNDLSMDKFHEIVKGQGHALAWHNALVRVKGGRVVRMESHDPRISMPGYEDLLRRYSRPPGDGVYGHRSEVTPLGMDPAEGLATLRYVSPYFCTAPTYRLINTTATNDPFLDGVELAMEAGGDDPLVMICLVPPPELAAKLAVEGGESADELHCTLLVLGHASSVTPAKRMAVHGAVSVLAANTSPIKGRIGGAGRFSNEPKEAYHALVDSQELSYLREQLLRRLCDAGVWQTVQDHGFVPHITLKYVVPTEPTPCRLDAVDVKFPGITVAVGDQWTTYEFMGAQAFQRPQERPMEEMYKRAGCMESDTPEQKQQKLAAYMKKMEEEREGMMSRLSKMEEDGKKKDVEMAALRQKMDAGAAKPEESEEEKKKKEDGKEQAMQRLVLQTLGLPEDVAAAKAKITSFGKLEENMVVMQREHAEVKAALQAEKTLKEQTLKLDAGRLWAREAIQMGRYDGLQQGSEEATIEFLSSIRAATPEVAEKMLHAEGSFQPSLSVLMTRHTEAGAPRGAPSRTPSGDVDRQWMTEIVTRQNTIMKAEPELAAHLAFTRAEEQARKEKPALFQQYAQLTVAGQE